MDTIPNREPFIQPLHVDWYRPYVAALDMLRLDVVHPVVSGNKWYKLKHNLQHAIEERYKTVLTFGGAYSNHLVAAAAAAKQYGLRSIGIVRGTYAQDSITPTLLECVEYGMELQFVSREEYAMKEEGDYLLQLSQRFDTPYIIPEGGANEYGRIGCEEIASFIDNKYTHICLAVGTGTSFCGVANALPADTNVYGYAPMKGGDYLNEIIDIYLEADKRANKKIYADWHFGGFGKRTDELIGFMNEFYRMNEIPLDMVYTGKMMAGIQQQLQQQVFPADARILCIHTGGLQGNASVQQSLIY